MRYQRMVLSVVVCGAIAGLTGCGGSSSSTSSQTASAPPIPPNTVDLQFADYHIHGGFYSSPITFHFIPKNVNDANITVDIDWLVRDANGNTIQSGTLPQMPANAQQDVIFDYANNPPGTVPYFIVLDPYNKIPEIDKNNNIVEVIAYGNTPYPSTANPGPNEVIWEDPHVHHPSPTTLIFHSVFANIGTSQTTLTNVPFQVTREDGTIVWQGILPSLPPGAQDHDSGPTQEITETPGEHTYTWTIDPQHTIPGNSAANDTIQDIVVVPANGSD